MRRVAVPLAALALAFAAAGWAQSKKYTGPKPPKPDLPYLLHATNLIPLEVGTATEESRKDDTANIVKGAASPARTPLAEPIFLLTPEKLTPEKLELFRVTVSKSGNREVVMPKNVRKMKDSMKPIRLSISKVDANIYRLEATEALENGSYCMSPSGSQDVFCFDVY
jgi:hypothetical protein